MTKLTDAFQLRPWTLEDKGKHFFKENQRINRIEEDEEFQRLEREVEMRRMAVRRMAEEDDDTQVYKKPWVDLTETQIQNIYYKVVDEHRGAPMPWGQVVFAQAVQAALKELNT